MPNLFQGIASGAGELKIDYRGPMIDLFNEEVTLLKGMEKVTEGWSGVQINRPLRVLRNQGVGATSDGGVLPTIGRQGTVQAVITSAFNYLRFGISGPMIKASANDKGSFVRAGAFELEMGYMDLKSDINRQLSWTGNGNLATVNAAVVASTSVVISGRESTEAALKFVQPGLKFDVYTSAGVLVQSSITVNSVTGTPFAATATIVCDQPVTASATDILVRSGSYGIEEDGLLTFLDGGTTTINNVDRSLYQQYQGNVLNLSGAALSLDAIQNITNQARVRGGGTKLDAYYCDYDTQRFYQKLLTADKRYSNTVKGDGGFANKMEYYLDFNGIPLIADKDCPRRLFVLSSQTWKNYVLAEMEYADESGSMYIPQSSSDQLETRIRYFANIFCEAPAANGALTNYVSP